ncbi:hypothetical protein LCGC14_0451580 [marine sediment metagenome]|uniref:PPM-type phosphatase domain-containing protein n=1 Tax=marine sediment metagenome TaxID=412755 RepID=A0A0F9SHN0_9ZZZZ|nr:serine/threonine-protein phosphatase [Phycisphaerae bacterium]HDZ43188.1 serine/threonine-protein phosphatase [Phycisphaerae bacterium]
MPGIMTPTEHEMDLALAAELQAALLPKGCPETCEHQRTGIRNRMCRSVGGDFYDFIELNPDQMAIVIGDVVGHGVRAALLMAQIMGFLRSDTQDRSRPANMVGALNEMLIALGDETDTILSCSLLYTVLDLPTGMGFMINAGHPPPIVCERDRCASHGLGGSDLVLGVEPYEPHEICHTFLPGERLVLYTDGLVDATNEAEKTFGDQRLLEVISACSDADPQPTADTVMDAVAAFRGDAPQRDDETIVVIDRC